MSIIKKVTDRCAERVFNAAISKINSKFECIFFFFYEPEFIDELLEEE